MFRSYVHHPKLFAYLLPGPIWALGLIIGSLAGSALPKSFLLTTFVLGYLSIAYATFEWGRIRGYPIKTAEAGISLTNFLRCSVMSAIMVIPASIVAVPFLIGATVILK
jgi:hypothetical protein